MNEWLPHKFEEKRPYLEKRMAMMRAVRSFFDTQNFMEVETPALQICPTVDTHIHAFQTQLKGADLSPQKEMYLHTSPEFAMKKLLVAGLPKVYQICHVFRNGEDTRLHNPEFTMIEWYRTHADYRDIMDDCVELLRYVASKLNIRCFQHQNKKADPFKSWEFLSVSEAFERFMGGELLEDTQAFAQAVAGQGVRVAEGDSWEDIFHAAMAEKIEPYLGVDVPTILYDYPASMASLSKKRGEVAERFELYVCGIELANAFSELTDADEQRARIAEDLDHKERLYGERYPIDKDFIKALEYGMPESGGIALGLDRLVMLCTGAENIAQVLWLPVQID